MSLTILNSGLDTRIVDGGRPNSRRLGVPVGAAADRESLAMANALVGNPPTAAAFEFAAKGPIVRAERDLGVAVVGAPFRMQRGRDPLEVGRSFNLSAGDELHIGGVPRGIRAYLSVAGGGLNGPIILGSVSSLQSLASGESIFCKESETAPRHLPRDCPVLQLPDIWTLHIVPGPQRDWFPGEGLAESLFTVNPASNRMGLRLDGPPLAWPGREMVSEPVCPGAIQITREGQPILLGVDGQTIGGYPKVAHVIDADLDLLGRMRPGDRLRFKWVDFDRADLLWNRRNARLREWRTRIEISLAGA